MNAQVISAFHKTRQGYLLFGLLELGLAYVLASVAINSGNLWEWALTLIFLFGCLQNFVRMLAVRKK